MCSNKWWTVGQIFNLILRAQCAQSCAKRTKVPLFTIYEGWSIKVTMCSNSTVEWRKIWPPGQPQQTTLVPKWRIFSPLQLLWRPHPWILNSRSIELSLNKSIGSAFCFWHLSLRASSGVSWRDVIAQYKRLLQIWIFKAGFLAISSIL